MKRREFLTSLGAVGLFTGTATYLSPAKGSLNTASSKLTPYAWDMLVQDISKHVNEAVECYFEEGHLTPQSFQKLMHLWLDSQLPTHPGYHLCSGWQLMFSGYDSMIINLSLCRKQNYTWSIIKLDTGIAWS